MGLNKFFGLIIIRREIIWWNFWMSCWTKSRKGTNLSVLRILPKGAGKLRQYESNPLASDSEDESRIRRAEAQAIRKKKTKRPSRYNKARPFFPNTTSSFGAAAPAGASSFLSSGRNPVLPTFQVRPDHSFRPYPSTSTQGPFTGACFACGDFTYFRRNCPFVGAEQRNSTAVKKWLWSDSRRWQERPNI